MKKTILLTVLLVMCGQASALISFHEDAEITDGDTYSLVYAFDDAIINITGGNVTTALVTFGSNTINVSGGQIQGLGTNSDSDSIFNIYSGAFIVDLSIGEYADAYISGGTIGVINASSSDTVNLTGGNITDYLIAYTEVNIYGYNFEYDLSAGDYNGGQLTGFWLNGGAFSIDLKNYGGGDMPIEITYDSLNLVPEPATLALLGLGGILTKRS